jgi:hypothetical protein
MSRYDLTRRDPMAEHALVRLRDALNTPHLDEAVRRYYDRQSGFAGHTFDSLGSGPTGEITCDDLLAVTLLDVSWKPPAVRALLVERTEEFNEQLCRIDSSATLWSDQGGQALTNAESLWDLVVKLPGAGPTTTSKLLARKRPWLIPITDSVIVSAVGTRGRTWATLRYCFQDADFQELICRLRPEVDDTSLLRVFDVAIWMLYSESKAARKVRKDVRIPD